MVHGKKGKRRRRIIIIRNGAKTISLPTLFGRLNYAQINTYWSYTWYELLASYIHVLLLASKKCFLTSPGSIM